MSRLDELIRELCPDGVEYKTLSELFNTRNGYTPSKSDPSYWQNGTVPWFRMEDIREHGRILDSAIQMVSRSAVKGELFPANSIIVATSATIGEHALLTVESLANQRFTYLILKPEYKNLFDIRFIYYYCFKLDKYCLECLNQGNFASVDMRKFHQFRFPIPPLPVQREIVRILDNFAELTAELTAKLTAELLAREKQYEYYRNLLFEQIEGEDFAISEIATTSIGLATSVTKHKREKGVILLHNSDIQQNAIVIKNAEFISEEFAKKNAKKILKENDIITVHTGDVGTSAVIKGEYIGAIGFTTITTRINDTKRVLPHYLCHYLNSHRCKSDIASMTISDRSNLNQSSYPA